MAKEDNKKVELHAKLSKLREYKRNYGLYFYVPYEKQLDFHTAGATSLERLLMAGNRLGKTYSAGYEVSYHVTGLYPSWWKGRTFTGATRGWVGSVTSELTRDGAQRILLGPIGSWGTGAIPKDCILDIKRARGVPDAVESVLIRHECGEISQVVFKAYKDGREAWQAEELHWVWFDEEPPFDIYIEGITRCNNTRGISFLTFTPLKGMSAVVLRFLNATDADKKNRHVTHMTIDDVNHYTDEQRAEIIAKYPEREREARAMGLPLLGEGPIYPVLESDIRESPLVTIPDHWRQIIGLDFGWSHPTAAIRLAYDPNNDIIHVVSAYRRSEATPIMHSAAIRAWGQWQPVAWPHDGLQHDKGSGEQLADLYRKQNLRMLSEQAQFPDKRGNGVEAGLMEILDRMQTGRFKVDINLSQWWEEFRMYHRKEGKVVKLNDDLLDATRYAMMMLRFALPFEDEPAPPDRYSRYRGANDSTWMAA